MALNYQPINTIVMSQTYSKMPDYFISSKSLIKPEKVAVKIDSYFSLLLVYTILQEFQYLWNMNFFKIFSGENFTCLLGKRENPLACLTEKST